jgi:hypothetical protein
MDVKRIQNLMVLPVPSAKMADELSHYQMHSMSFTHANDLFDEIINIFRKEDDFLKFEIGEDEIKNKQLLVDSKLSYNGFYLIDVKTMTAFYCDGMDFSFEEAAKKLEIIDSFFEKKTDQYLINFPIIFLNDEYEIPKFLITLQDSIIETKLGMYVSPGFKFKADLRENRQKSLIKSGPDYYDFSFLVVDDKKFLRCITQRNKKQNGVFIDYENLEKKIHNISQTLTKEEMKFVHLL